LIQLIDHSRDGRTAVFSNMPVSIRKNKGGSYRVSTPNRVHAKHTTKAKAKSQERLLNAIDHGWTPTGKKAKRKKKHESMTAGELTDLLLAGIIELNEALR
jgi:hypothetical protein